VSTQNNHASISIDGCDTQKRKSLFSQLPDYFTDLPLDHMSRGAFLDLFRYLRNLHTTVYHGSYRTLADLCHISKGSVRTVLTNWEEVGLILLEEDPDTSLAFTFLHDELWAKNDERYPIPEKPIRSKHEQQSKTAFTDLTQPFNVLTQPFTDLTQPFTDLTETSTNEAQDDKDVSKMGEEEKHDHSPILSDSHKDTPLPVQESVATRNGHLSLKQDAPFVPYDNRVLNKIEEGADEAIWSMITKRTGLKFLRQARRKYANRIADLRQNYTFERLDYALEHLTEREVKRFSVEYFADEWVELALKRTDAELAILNTRLPANGNRASPPPRKRHRNITGETAHAAG
jgi:hypothetical protein